jgi:uncharacterized protein
MKVIFIDSGFPIALLSANDHLHQRAVAQNQEMNRLLKSNQVSFLTTRAVLLEIGARLSKPLNRVEAAQTISIFETSPDVETVEITKVLFERGLQLFSSRKDKKWSLCDCISFVVMTERSDQKTLFQRHGF